jgi:hypothetical protein
MARIVRYGPGGRVHELILDGVAAEWEGKPGTLIDPDESSVAGLPVSQWRVDTVTFLLRAATATELAADDASDLEARRAAIRDAAVRLLQNGLEAGEPLAILLRVLLRTISQENTRIKAGQPVRSALELWTAMKNAINLGQGDSSL